MATILIVDDRATNRDFLLTLLGYGKHRLLEATDGAEALAVVRAKRPDLVITDILMPTMDGYEFVRQLRADASIAGTAVIFYTAHYHKTEAQALAKRCGIAHILIKPCEPEIILRAVADSLGNPLQIMAPLAAADFDDEHLRVVTDKLSRTTDQLQAANQHLSALVDIGLQLASEREPHTLLNNVCRAARDLLGAKYAVLAIGSRDEGNDVYYTTSGMDAATAKRLDTRVLSEGIVGKAFTERKSRRVGNLQATIEATGLPLLHPPVKALLVAPIVSLAHRYGWICLTDKIGAEEFNADDEQLMTILGAQVGRIYENGSLYAEIQGYATRLEVEIAQRRQTQETLVESEQRFRQIAENIGEVFWLTDSAKNQILYVSPAYEQIWSRSCESLYASPHEWMQAIHPDDRARVTGAAQKQGRGEYCEEYRIVRPDGSIRWICDRAFPVVRNGSEVYRVAGLAEDITERKRAEDELRESERRFSGMLANLEMLSVMLDENATITYCNDYFLRLTNWQRAQVVGRNFLDLFVPPELTEELHKVYKALLADLPHAWHYENEILTRSGSRLIVRWNNSVLRSAGGTIIGVASIGEDVTEQKRAEEKIRRLNRVYAVLSGINTLIVRVHDRQQLFDEACQIAVVHGNFGIAWIGLLDAETLEIIPMASAGLEADGRLARRKSSAAPDHPEGNGIVGRAVRERRLVFSNSIAAETGTGERRKEAIRLGYLSRIALPLMIEGAVLGVLVLYARERDFFNAEELKLLDELADDIAFALAHIEQQAKLARLSRVRAVSGGINAAIVRARNRQELLDEACHVAVTHGNFDMTWGGVFDADTFTITPIAWAGSAGKRPAWIREPWQVDVANGNGVGSRAIRGKQPIFDNDIAAGSAVRNNRRLEAVEEGFRSIIALPFIAQGKVVAQMSLYSKDPDFFTKDEVKLLAEVADNISFALEHFDAQEKLEKLSRIRSVSGATNAAIVRINDRELLLKEICRIAVEMGKFELVWIADLDQKANRVHPVAWAGFPSHVAHAVDWKAISGAHASIAESMRTRSVAVRNDIKVQAKSGLLREEALKRGCGSTVCLPLVVDGNVEAGIVLYAPGTDFFDPGELALLKEVASDISFALGHIAKATRLNYLAYYDELTGLPNRALLQECMARVVRRAREEKTSAAIVMCDIKRFSQINSTLGRQAGDAVLRDFGQRLKGLWPEPDNFGRISADWFGGIVANVKDAPELAHLIENSLARALNEPFHVGSENLRISVTTGIAMFPTDGDDPDAMFRNAEAALKKAKTGGEHYLFYHAKMNAAVTETLRLENNLRRAIDREEFVLHYQPKVNLLEGRISGLEALIRWNDPETGLVPPVKFIPLLEETGMIIEVGAWALRKALHDYGQWHAQGLKPPRIAVNVSSIQLRQKNFVEVIGKVIEQSKSVPHGLDLEITESLIMDDIEGNVAKLKALRAMGINIAIDDFGTGYSSLGYLARLPVNLLKIDRSFVITMTLEADSMSIVSTIISLAHSLKMKVIAEGVETEEQARFLKLLKCDEMQGYLFSKPLPAQQLTTLLEKHA